MIFNAFTFLFLFLPLVMAVVYVPGLERLRVVVLLLASLAFYGFAGIEHAIVLVVDTIWVYSLTFRPGMERSKVRVTLAVIPPALALIYYKYMTFLLVDVLNLSQTESPETFDLFGNVILPAGISFFTFQLISYAIDRYRGEIETPPQPLRFALYVSFFPQLVAGPILRFHDVMDPLKKLSTYRLNAKDLREAIGYITIGLAVKVLLADTLGDDIAPLVAAPGALDSLSAVYVILGYSFQIYFDFYGYSMIAIGLGRLFGFHFPANFNRPYDAVSIKDFWRRWHITLCYWIRDYLYFPLGGNKAYVRNIIIVFGLCGLWHGAGWNFVIWGLYHGALTGLYHVGRRWWDAMPHLMQVGLNFTLVSLGWVLFIFNFEGAAAFSQSLLGQGTASLAGPDGGMWLILGMSALVCFGPRLEPLIERQDGEAKLSSWAMTSGLAGLFILTLAFIDRSNTFIYFRF